MLSAKFKNIFKTKLSLTMIGKFSLFELNKKAKDCRKSQEDVLRDILSISKDTEYGKKYHFDQILESPDATSLFERFEKNVPVVQYEDIYPLIERHKNGEENVLFPGKPKMYATTNNSIYKAKWIPITNKYYNDVYNRMSPFWLYTFLARKKNIYNGLIVSNVGKTIEGAAEDGTVYGSVAGVAQRDCPSFLKSRFASPSAIFMIDDYKSRYYTIMRMGIEQDIRLVIGGNPSTLIEMQKNVDEFLDDIIEDIEKGTLSYAFLIPENIRATVNPYLKPNPQRANELRELKKKYSRLLPKHFWPNLQVLNVWKSGNCAVYFEKIKDYFPESCDFVDQGYFTPECRPGLVIVPNSDSTVIFPHKNYFEFVREKDLDLVNPKFFHLDELKVGESYCIFVTNYSGLYRYNLNDLIQVTDFYLQTPMISYKHNINGYISINGERLNENQFINAVHQVENLFSKRLAFFVGFASVNEARYHFYFEFIDSQIDDDFVVRFTNKIDSILNDKNIEYAEMRNSEQLHAPIGHLLQLHSFELFKSRIIDQGLYYKRFNMSFLMQDELRHGMIKKLIKRKFS